MLEQFRAVEALDIAGPQGRDREDREGEKEGGQAQLESQGGKDFHHLLQLRSIALPLLHVWSSQAIYIRMHLIGSGQVRSG